MMKKLNLILSVFLLLLTYLEMFLNYENNINFKTVTLGYKVNKSSHPLSLYIIHTSISWDITLPTLPTLLLR